MSPPVSTTAARRPPRQAPRQTSVPSSGQRLSVLDRASLAERGRLRRARSMFLLATGVLAISLGVVVGTQALVASQQISLDAARQQLAQSVAVEQQLQFRRSELEAPARILSLAESKLHMVAPAQVTYLAPVSVGRTLSDSTQQAPASSKDHGRGRR